MFRARDAFSSYSVDDVARAKQFYATTLGLEVKDEMGGLALSVGAHRVHVYQKDDHAPASFTVLNFLVEDIASAHRELTGLGVRFDYADDATLGTDTKGIYWGLEQGNGPNIAWFRDPAGNILSIVQDG